MRALPSELRIKSERLLQAYGGLDGLSRNPPWVIALVLKTWFTEGERKLVTDFILQRVGHEARSPILKELTARH